MFGISSKKEEQPLLNKETLDTGSVVTFRNGGDATVSRAVWSTLETHVILTFKPDNGNSHEISYKPDGRVVYPDLIGSLLDIVEVTEPPVVWEFVDTGTIINNAGAYKEYLYRNLTPTDYMFVCVHPHNKEKLICVDALKSAGYKESLYILERKNARLTKRK